MIDYEAKYNHLLDELEKVNAKNKWLAEELERKDFEINRLVGFQQAVVLIFRGDYDV